MAARHYGFDHAWAFSAPFMFARFFKHCGHHEAAICASLQFEIASSAFFTSSFG